MAVTRSLHLTLVSSTVSPRARYPPLKDSGRRRLTGVVVRSAQGILRTSAAQAPKLGKKFSVSCAGKSPDDLPAKGKDNQDEKGEFVAPRVTPDYVRKDSINPPPRVVKNLEGPWITRWGGNVRGGKYHMGQGTDRIIDIFANGNGMLAAAGALIVLFFFLLQFRPDGPPPPPKPGAFHEASFSGLAFGNNTKYGAAGSGTYSSAFQMAHATSVGLLGALLFSWGSLVIGVACSVLLLLCHPRRK